MSIPPSSKTPSGPSAVDPVEAFLQRRKKATINDVASLAQVSKKTVSRVINNSPSVRAETREQVNAIINRIGFKPDPQARGLAFRRSFLLGLIYDNPNAQYVVNIQAGILDCIRGSGTEIIVHPCDKNSDDFLEEIRDFVELQRLAGVILLPPIAENRQLLAMLDDLDVPYVRITAMHGAENTPPILSPQVVSRDRQGCLAAAEHLVELGHTRIGFISGPAGYASARERRQGFDEGLARHGLSLSDELITGGEYTFESGFEAARHLLALSPRPTAIFASNDEMAIGAYKAAAQLGLTIPDELSVIGYDDAPIASRITPGLTSVKAPIRDIGRTAAETLISEEKPRRNTTIFDTALIVRESTGPREPDFKP
ncbi:LacI family DNA-binding transcriptional regulator [Asticcacaulis sp. BYS171W]|uniref:LacI family DNA-binding transcriptional regulator n=1 Tax=Asticcacaulis aquaticus TaxID=2984212 RepID=A0ABT5HRM8_9CAUL|nr:LacI family DNA-binding transcriptional regulator [Asticcacaulis aquaticus]MDC7682721.1 LacI family DNA-binding transcriptional regulator [Asticcacaulis aquaticus]